MSFFLIIIKHCISFYISHFVYIHIFIRTHTETKVRQSIITKKEDVNMIATECTINFTCYIRLLQQHIIHLLYCYHPHHFNMSHLYDCKYEIQHPTTTTLQQCINNILLLLLLLLQQMNQLHVYISLLLASNPLEAVVVATIYCYYIQNYNQIKSN